MQDLIDAVRYAARRLRLTPGFTLAALVTLALGIGANTALFSVVHAVLLRALPFKEPERLYSVWSRHTSTDRYPFQLAEFCDYRDQNKTLEVLAGFANWSASLADDGPAERVPGLRVSDSFFEMLGARPLLGRALRTGDDTPGSEKVVVLSFGFWQRRFGGDAGIVGRSVNLNGEAYNVVGVLDRGFVFPIPSVELAIPLAPDHDPWRHDRNTTHFVRLIGRARPGVSGAEIVADLDPIAQRLKAMFPDSYARKSGVLVVSYHEELTQKFSRTLWLLLGAVGLLLLIACANLANLMLVRAGDRRKDMAIRLALGASRSQLIRELLVESALLALGGAALGLLLARWAVPILVALNPAALPQAIEIRISLPVLFFTLGAAVLSGLTFGLAPAVRAARDGANADLQAEGRGAAGTLDRSRSRGLIVTGQIALMMVLLVGTGLLVRSFREVMRVEPGFDPAVLTVRLSLPRKDYGQTAKVARFYRELEARVARIPGVTSVAAANHVPLDGAQASADYKVSDRPPASEDQVPTALYRMVTPAYFRTMGIPVVAGRAFVEEDREGGPLVAIISQALARQSFPDRDAVGQHLLVDDNPAGYRSLEIVGVAGDVKHASLEADAEPHLYVPYAQTHPELLVWLTSNQFLVVRTKVAPLSLADAIRRELQTVDPRVASADARTSGYYVEAASASRRFTLRLLAIFAALALVLAALGIYGVTSYAVFQRTREIGIRRALGARMNGILGLVLLDSAKQAALGMVLGLFGTVAANHTLASQLYGVKATDPATYAAVVVLLSLLALGASLPPAWRATRVDPVVALRQD
jgi:putative ABC transport system permease protein